MPTFLPLISLFASMLMSAGPGKKQILRISNLDEKHGKLYIAWYNNAADFKKPDKAVFQAVSPVKNQKECDVIFSQVPSGTYAVAIFFDENNNGKMDTNFFGIPKEKYGFSNNAYPLMRAASFSEASFQVKDIEDVISIRLK
jgi:uncharacterized protein (DUF2141 family)